MSVMVAVAARQMQFVAGPQSHTFHVCAEHLPDLYRSWYANGLFYTIERWTVTVVDPADEIECDSCRGEDGP